VPSRARLFGSVCVGQQLSVDDVGESPFEAAQGFQRGLAGGELAPVVGAALGVAAQLPVQRVLSDNGSAYKSHLWHATCLELLDLAQLGHEPENEPHEYEHERWGHAQAGRERGRGEHGQSQKDRDLEAVHERAGPVAATSRMSRCRWRP
jgi:hypothetical protein